MGRKSVSMRKARKLLQLKYESGLGVREISRSLKISHGSVVNYLRRAESAGLSWPLPPQIDDEELQDLLLSCNKSAQEAPRPLPSMEWVHNELGRTKGMTLQLLWEEYRQNHPDGYGYSQFCEYYRQYKGSVEPALRQPYLPGEKMLVDWAGETIPVTDPRTGIERRVYLFVACLGASNYTFAKAFENTKKESWIQAHQDAWEFMGGVTKLTIPDNDKSGVDKACYYEPILNRTYEELAEHFGTVVLPTRMRKAKDKAKAEKAVQHSEGWIIAVLRNQTFFSLGALNRAIKAALDDLNHRPFKKMSGCRWDRYQELDKPALQPLPTHRYEMATWRKSKVNIDYHIQVDWHFYSVPYPLLGQMVEVRMSARNVEVFHKGKRVALHQRSQIRGAATTDSAHQPKAHREHLEWSPSRLIQWARNEVGPHCGEAVSHILKTKPHPEVGYRSCLGLIRLNRHYGKERVEAACFRALALDVCTYRSIKSILSKRLDQQPLPDNQPMSQPVVHANLRGSDYYQ